MMIQLVVSTGRTFRELVEASVECEKLAPFDLLVLQKFVIQMQRSCCGIWTSSCLETSISRRQGARRHMAGK